MATSEFYHYCHTDLETPVKALPLSVLQQPEAPEVNGALSGAFWTTAEPDWGKTRNL